MGVKEVMIGGSKRNRKKGVYCKSRNCLNVLQFPGGVHKDLR